MAVRRIAVPGRWLALSMAHYALMRMGRSDDEADAVDEMRRKTSLGIKAFQR